MTSTATRPMVLDVMKPAYPVRQKTRSRVVGVSLELRDLGSSRVTAEYCHRAPTEDLHDRGVGIPGLVKATGARRAQSVLLERDVFLCEPPTQSLGYCRPAVACELSTIVGQEERLVSRPDVRGPATPNVLADRLDRERLPGWGAPRRGHAFCTGRRRGRTRPAL